MDQQWYFQPHDQQLVELIEKSAGVSPLLARLLASRNFSDPVAIRNFLDAPLMSLQDPGELAGAFDAAELILEAIRQKQKIIVHGDYDADGMTGAAILVRCISMLEGIVGYFVPNRLEEGYGLSADSLRDLIGRGAELIISVDCGIASVEEAKLVRDLGARLIITDHHQYGDQLPDAEVIVHPGLPSAVYPHAPLCGAGVAFKVAWSLCKLAGGGDKVDSEHREYLMSALGLAAIGTVADVVPLVGENRVIVRHGLKCLKQNPLPGVQRLMTLCKLDEKPELAADDIGFAIGPRLNAAGRLGQAQLGIELLVSDCPKRTETLANYIDNLNVTRDKLQRSVLKEAKKQIEESFDPHTDPALVLDGRGWHAGVIGIVAGKVADMYNTPAIVISRPESGGGPAVGSARSAGVIDLHRALIECTDHLVGHGGHAAAAGLKVEEEQIEAFRSAFLEHVASESSVSTRVSRITIDIEALFSQLTLHAMQEMDMLAPFGNANSAPVFCSTGVKLAAPPKKMGGGERHLSLQLSQHEKRIRAVAFGCGEWADELEKIDSTIDIAYRPVINEFRGYRNVELHLVDWRASRDAVVAGQEE